MDKLEFLSAVQTRLIGLPEEDITRSLDYYIEMIDDRMEDGMSEEEAVAAMGSPEDAAAQILQDMPLPKLVKARARRSSPLRIWEIVLLVLGSPVWLPLLLAVAVVAFSVLVVIWSFALCFWAMDLSCVAVAAVGVSGFLSELLHTSIDSALFQLGCGFVALGLAILLFFFCRWFSLQIVRLSAAFLRMLKSSFIKKEASR